MVTSQKCSTFFTELLRHSADDLRQTLFDLEWMGGRFGIIEACGAQLYVCEQAPDSIAAVELVAEPQLMCLLIDFEEAGRQPSPLFEARREESLLQNRIYTPSGGIAQPSKMSLISL